MASIVLMNDGQGHYIANALPAYFQWMILCLVGWVWTMGMVNFCLYCASFRFYTAKRRGKKYSVYQAGPIIKKDFRQLLIMVC
ncbi:MAG: hypothetical protein WDO19_15130 [Bacteroidota bacterium]